MHASPRFHCVTVLAIALASLASLASVQPAHAQATGDKRTAAAPDEPSLDRKLIDKAIQDLKVFSEGQTEPMRSHVVMRWPNNVRGTKDGATVLLTENGRPRAACCIYTWQGDELHYGFGSLSTQGVSAEVDGATAWHPTEPGLEFVPIPAAPEPAASPTLRIRQMRHLLCRFRSRYIENETTFDELRLLSKPVYRYELGEPAGDAELVDGAVFAFVQGTDPESLLLIEARRADDGKLTWHYATAKRTVGQINMRLDGKPAQTHKWGGWNRFEPNAIFSTLRRPIKSEE